MSEHRYSEVETEMGKFRVAFGPNGITAIDLCDNRLAEFENVYRRRFGVRPEPGKLPQTLRRAVQNAAAGREYDPVPVDLSGLPEFHLKVLQALRRVPRGKVQTYSWLAQKAGKPRAARAVGNAMARNPVPFLIPCHRIVPASGGTGNYGLGRERKRELLRLEGVPADRL